MAQTCVELDMMLQGGVTGYTLALRIQVPDSAADIGIPAVAVPGLAPNDPQLLALALDPLAYGKHLSAILFVDPQIRSHFAQARSVAETRGIPLRIRLSIAPDVSELHTLSWETLHDPERGELLCTSERVLFSRYLSSNDWRPVQLASRPQLRALIAIANPQGLDQYRPGGQPLAPIDVDGELARVRQGLGAIRTMELVSNGQATLEAILTGMRAGCDILYLVCHGALIAGVPRLWLEDEQGNVAVTDGRELAAQVRELERPPLLVVLISCQSGGTRDAEAQAALGPLLAAAGVPAVLAMQGNVSMPTMAAFVPRFFAELQHDGQIDRALAVARGRVRQEPDACMPVLWMRLRDGWLVTARSYQADIQRLRERTDLSLQLIARHAVLPFSSGDQPIQRECAPDLRRIAYDNSLLIVGEPGAGKSGVIYDFARTLTTDRQDVLFLVADDLDAGSLGSLREELGLEHDLIDVLDNWLGMEPAYLVIDSLDSVRDTRTEAMLQNLMRTVIQRQGRWQVVASIRKYDLRYSGELKDLFRGTVEARFQDPEFSATRHINVPRLSDAELAQITSHSLRTLIDIAPSAMLELLRVPFNLRLIADLLDTGVDLAEISPIRTQLELLNRYWEARVLGRDGQGDARDDVLRIACSRMVSARVLRCERTQIANVATSQQVDALLRSHVLIEQAASSLATVPRRSVAFSHHVLFDYAVARLLLYDEPQRCPDRLADDPDLVLFIQPSFLLLYRMLWSQDESHDAFWDLAFRMMEENRVPPIAQIVSCMCVAELTTRSDDLAVLWEHLYSRDLTEQTVAERLFGHLIGALQTDPEPLVFPKAEAWCEVTERVTRALRPAIAYPVRLLILLLSEEPERLSQPQLTNLGLAARRLLEFAWSEPQRNEILVRQALQAVCRTFASDSRSATAMLERCLHNPHLSQYGYADLPVIARHLGWILAVAPEFVEQIYTVTFSYEETSDAPTSMSGSRIMNLTSNRRQDFEGARYQLTQFFPSFLSQQPSHATWALLVVLAAYIHNHYTSLLPAPAAQTFDVDGRTATIFTDYSEQWDKGHRHHENAIQMLDAFERHLDTLSQDEQQRTKLRTLVEPIMMYNPFAIVWRRVLRSAARYPATLGEEVHPLAWAKPLFLENATRVELGHFIAAVYPLADRNDRERIEQFLLSAPDAIQGERRADAEAWRDRVIRSLPDRLILPEAQVLRAQIGVPDGLQDDTALDDPFTWIPDISSLTTAPRQVEGKFGELALPIHQFLQQYTDETVNEEGTEAVFPAICTLYESLQQPLGESADDEIAFNKAWDTLALACRRVAALQSLDCQDERGILLRQMLLMSSKQAHPIRGVDEHSHFEETPSWGVGYARLEAAQGLMRFVNRIACIDQEILDSLVRLCHDPVPAVRYQVAVRLLSLLRVAPDLAWSLLEELCHQEGSRGVLQHICTFVLRRLASSDPERVIPLVETIFDRTETGPGAQQVRTSCVRIFFDLDLGQAHPTCRTRIQQIVSDPARYKDQAQHILGSLRRWLTYGQVEPADPVQEAVRGRAFELLRMLIESTRSGISRLESTLRGVLYEAWPPEATDEMRSLMQLFDHIALELYFASGAFDAHRDNRSDEEPPLTEAQRRRFYIEVEPLINEIAEVSYPSITDHLVELLEECISFDPRGVFLHVATVIRAGQNGGYATESIAADRIVRLVERYLAEYRSLLHQDEACRRALMDILSIFVGWPQAHRLIYRLDEIYR